MDFFSPFPKYLQVAEILRKRIQRQLKVGDQMPTEAELCLEFGLSRETIREALRLLDEEGLLNRQPGRGTFVAKTPAYSEPRLTGLVEDLYRLKQDIEWQVLEKKPLELPPDIAAAMMMPPDEMAYRIVRLQLYNKEPLAYHESYLRLEYGLAVAKAALDRPIILELESSMGVDCREEYHKLDAVAADTHMASALKVNIGAPLLLMTRVLVDKAGRAVVAFHSHYRADRYYYTLKLPITTQAQREATKAGRKRR
jgi:GntR family transcriptional regulator